MRQPAMSVSDWAGGPESAACTCRGMRRKVTDVWVGLRLLPLAQAQGQREAQKHEGPGRRYDGTGCADGVHGSARTRRRSARR
eukprot:2926983-Pleurochrysis_carterae.AAC.1